MRDRLRLRYLKCRVCNPYPATPPGVVYGPPLEVGEPGPAPVAVHNRRLNAPVHPTFTPRNQQLRVTAQDSRRDSSYLHSASGLANRLRPSHAPVRADPAAGARPPVGDRPRRSAGADVEDAHQPAGTRLVDRLASELRAEGIGEGDRVVLWVPNHWRTPIYLFALWKLGAIVVPFDREMNPDAGTRIVGSVEARCVLVGYDERRRGPAKGTWWNGGNRALATEPRAANGIGHRRSSPRSHSLPGTTGDPKGCMITHANLLSQLVGARERIRWTQIAGSQASCHCRTCSS